MSDLIAIAFDDPQEADRVLTELNRLKQEYLIDLSDAVVVIRQADGKVHLKQSVNLVGTGAASGGLSGAVWGTLVGLLFLNPLAGFAIGGLAGAGAGALSGSLLDYGIDDKFIRSLAENLKPDSSALFLLVRKVQPEKVLAELSQFKGHVIRTSLSPEQEAKLQKAISAA
ncbi:MAG TPA: DUF1269 domain-containing protein [Rhizobiaceae bacterium]